MRRNILIILGVVILALAILASYFIAEGGNKQIPKPEKIVKTVFVDTVKNGAIPIMIAANGNLVAKRRLALYSEVQGVFKTGRKLFKEGQEYKKGETIISIDAAEYYASVQSAKSNLYNLITAIMPDLRLDYPLVFSKWQKYLINFDINKGTPELPEMTSEKEKFFISGKGILTNYYNVKNLEQRLAKYQIRAPYTGILIEALVTEGTLVRSGQKLVEFINTNVYELEVAIGKTYSDLLRIGKSVALTNLNKTKTYTGKVTRINGRVDQASQTITAFIEVANDDLREGMFLEANLNAKEEENAIEIDRGLLLENNRIYVVKDSVLDYIDVNPIYFTEKKVVLKNVPDGEVIVSKPVVGAYAGMLVSIYEAKTKAAK
tara:strand:- start:372 stop:1499 length:1128 start_codon:yes stop_codon:yes gene_type:complete